MYFKRIPIASQRFSFFFKNLYCPMDKMVRFYPIWDVRKGVAFQSKYQNP